MDIFLGLQGYFPVFTLSILICLQGLNFHGWRGQAEAGSKWRKKVLYVFRVTAFILKGSNQEQLSVQPLQRSFARREQNRGQNQKGSTGPLWKKSPSPSLLAELGSLQVNSLPCNRVINLWTHIIHVPTYSIYREFCSAMRRAKGDQCTMKIPLKWWLTVRQPCSSVQGMCNKMNI